MKIIASNLLILFTLVLFVSADKPKLIKIKVNDRITVYIPENWRPMDDLDFGQRYPSIRAPLAAFTNEERVADFSVNISATQWPDANLEIAKKFFRSSLMNMFDRVEFIDEGIETANKNKFIYFEFESRVSGSRQQEGLKEPVMRYTYIQYLIQGQQTFVFSFNCPRRAKDQWQETAHEMMKRIKFK